MRRRTHSLANEPHERRRWTPFVATGAVTVFNRAILLFTGDSEAVRRIHGVCCRLDDIASCTSVC